jgi:hypothetical protein
MIILILFTLDLYRILFRLYWSLVKGMYGAIYVSVKINPSIPYYIPFNILLIVLYGMQVYWFGMIIKLLIKILTGNKVEDSRETDDDKAARKAAVESNIKKEE